MTVRPFTISTPQAVLDDLDERLARTRFTTPTRAGSWDEGTNPAYLKTLCAYWRDGFDWRRQEAWLNGFPQFRAELDGEGLHFIHMRGRGERSIPLLLLHGWPDSFQRFLKIIPLLTDPGAHGLGREVAFDVVVPSLPGFGFSDRPSKLGLTFEIGDLMHRLMTEELGYERFAVHGGDFGSMVAEHIARSHAGSVIGLHLTDVPFFHMFQKPKDPSHAEEGYLKAMEAFSQKEGAYALLQSTKPQSLASGLNDSPAGLAAWIVEKLRSWSDCDGEVERRFSKDEILTGVTIYWVTQTIDSSFQPYFDLAHAGPVRWISEGAKTWLGRHDTPTAFALFPKDLVPAPRDWAERFFNVQRWTPMPRGGHFAAFEEPRLLAQDLRATFGAEAMAHAA